MQHLKISQVTYIRQLRQSEASTIFLVKLQCNSSNQQEKEKEKFSVMKVYRNVRTPKASSPESEYNNFLCESRAYRRLEERGLCKRGVVPRFYGIIENIKPNSWGSHLDMFRKDELLPNAVLMEYIPNMRMMSVPYFIPELLDKLERILKDIHAAGVLHADPYPRNMMVVPGTPGTPDRVLWIDFDRAQTWPLTFTASSETYPAPPPEKQQRLFGSEALMMEQFVEAAKKDRKEYPGRYKHTYGYYFDGYTPDEGRPVSKKS